MATSSWVPPASTPRVAAAYGGGGLFGIGYILGVTEALTDGGVDFSEVPSLGTSAGSWAAAALALRIRFLDALDPVADDAPRWPDPRRGRLHRIAAQGTGRDTRCPTVRAVACSLPRFRRTALLGAEHPIADLVSASSAVPGMLAPHAIGGRRYVDGGVRSLASVDLADPADLLLVVLPLSGPMFGPAGRFVERRTRHELAIWQATAAPSTSIVVRPTRAIARLVNRPDQLFDAGRARRCYELAYEQGVTLRDEWADAMSSLTNPVDPVPTGTV